MKNATIVSAVALLLRLHRSYVTSTYRFLRVSLSILSRPPGSQLSIKTVNRRSAEKSKTNIALVAFISIENVSITHIALSDPRHGKLLRCTHTGTRTDEYERNIAKSPKNRKDVAPKLFTPRKPRFIFSSLECMYVYNVYCYCLFISTANISSFYTTYTHASMYEMSNE